MRLDTARWDMSKRGGLGEMFVVYHGKERPDGTEVQLHEQTHGCFCVVSVAGSPRSECTRSSRTRLPGAVCLTNTAPAEVTTTICRTVVDSLTNVTAPLSVIGMAIRILIADDRKASAWSFRIILDAPPDMTVVGETADRPAACDLT